jgi:hypothetical protein
LQLGASDQQLARRLPLETKREQSRSEFVASQESKNAKKAGFRRQTNFPEGSALRETT